MQIVGAALGKARYTMLMSHDHGKATDGRNSALIGTGSGRAKLSHGVESIAYMSAV